MGSFPKKNSVIDNRARHDLEEPGFLLSWSLPMPPSPLARLAPPLFVVIWATGFIVARTVAPYAEPLTFLLVRYLLALLVLGIVVLAARAPWPRTGREWRNGLIAGALLHGCYLGGVFWSV